MKFGIPRVVTTDQGSEFNNKLDSELMTLLNVDHRLTTYIQHYIYQQANGLYEWFNHPQVIILDIYNIKINYYYFNRQTA